MTAAAHDPGGKVRLALPSGVTGDAVFSPCGRYRQLLTRAWGADARFALWIGMNPSTAAVDCDDPTVRRECIYTRDRLLLGAYVKANVMDYRATDPTALLAPGVIACSPDNSGVILDAARRAEIVIAAWGALPKRLRHHAGYVENLLKHEGIKLHCLGFTKDGSPRHPLYVKGDAVLLDYPGEAAHG